MYKYIFYIYYIHIYTCLYFLFSSRMADIEIASRNLYDGISQGENTRSIYHVSMFLVKTFRIYIRNVQVRLIPDACVEIRVIHFV